MTALGGSVVALPTPADGGLSPLSGSPVAPLPADSTTESATVAPVPAHPPTTFEEKWPIEYVLRPQTIPENSLQLATSADYFRLQAGPLHTAGGIPYSFHSDLIVGLSGSYGATDGLELGISAPRVLCFAASEPSGCNDFNRLNGSGLFLDYGLVRTRPFQLLMLTGLSVWRSNPVTFAWAAGLRAKFLFREVVALELAASASPPLEAVQADDPYLQLTFVSDLNVQVTRQLLVFADLDLYAPSAHLDAPAVEGVAGAAWTFENRVDLGLRAGLDSLFGNRSWRNSVPGSFYLLTLRFFFSSFARR